MKNEPQQNPVKVLIIFFLGLLLMLALELFTIWALSQITWLPAIGSGLLNTMLGLPAAVVGGALVIWSVRIQYVEGHGTPYPKVSTRNLVTSGPYACTRNPMTLGAGLFYLGIAFWAGSMSAIVIILIVFTGLLRYIYVHETEELSIRFGEAYENYRRDTAFLIPCLVKKKRI